MLLRQRMLRFKELAYAENLEATVVAKVTEKPYLVMHWNGKQIVNISRAFLDSNGAEKHIDITPDAPSLLQRKSLRTSKRAIWIGTGFERML